MDREKVWMRRAPTPKCALTVKGLGSEPVEPHCRQELQLETQGCLVCNTRQAPSQQSRNTAILSPHFHPHAGCIFNGVVTAGTQSGCERMQWLSSKSVYRRRCYTTGTCTDALDTVLCSFLIIEWRIIISASKYPHLRLCRCTKLPSVVLLQVVSM